jgi:hypothetical protein
MDDLRVAHDVAEVSTGGRTPPTGTMQMDRVGVSLHGLRLLPARVELTGDPFVRGQECVIDGGADTV